MKMSVQLHINVLYNLSRNCCTVVIFKYTVRVLGEKECVKGLKFDTRRVMRKCNGEGRMSELSVGYSDIIQAAEC